MNALDLLTKQHRETDELFDALKEATIEQKEDRFGDLADALAVHTVIEEKHFYPAVMAKVDADPVIGDLVRAAAEEHLGVKRFIADLLEIDPDDPAFDAKMNVLEEQVKHHVKEEENELFPKVQKVLDRQALEALGRTMEATATALHGTEPRNDVPRQTIAAAPVETGKGGRHAA